ncbi:MAG: hypothetical protein R3A48_14260 [Polyangiales bacterium]
MKRSPTAPPLDPERLARIRGRVLVTLAAGSLAAVGCDRTPDHTLNRPVTVHPPAPPRAPAPPVTADSGAIPYEPEEGHSVNEPPAPPRPVVVDSGIAPVRVTPGLEGIQMPRHTSNPPAPVMPRLPPGNG